MDDAVLLSGTEGVERLRPLSMGRKLSVWTGLLFVLGALAVNVPFALLISSFDYPDILRRPTAEVLTRFHEGGSGLILTWLALAWVGVPLLAGILLLRRVLEEGGHRFAGVATTFGVIGAVVQMVGLLRWVFVVPGLSEAYTGVGSSEATRAAAEVTFRALHQYGGVVLGEHLGQAFTIAWMVMVSVMMLRSRRIFPPRLGWLGLAGGAVYSIAQLELLATVIPDIAYWGAAGLVGSLVWLGWMTVMGVILIRHRPEAA